MFRSGRTRFNLEPTRTNRPAPLRLQCMFNKLPANQGITDRVHSSTPGHWGRKGMNLPPINPLLRISKVIAADSSIGASRTCDRTTCRQALQEPGVG